MRIYSLTTAPDRELAEDLRRGAIIVYPTDTIYGIGCSALAPRSIRRIRALKGTNHPLSVIAPSKEWIRRHLKVRYPAFLSRLPGPVTLILEKKNPGFLKDAAPGNTLGVRMLPGHFHRLVRRAGIPVITTSVNRTGKRPIRRISQIPQSFLSHIDVVIDGGVLNNPPSRIFDLTGEQPKRIR